MRFAGIVLFRPRLSPPWFISGIPHGGRSDCGIALQPRNGGRVMGAAALPKALRPRRNLPRGHLFLTTAFGSAAPPEFFEAAFPLQRTLVEISDILDTSSKCFKTNPEGNIKRPRQSF